MKKERIHIEYLLNASSRSILWNAISTPVGLEDWFADQVQMREKIFTFTWGKSEVRKAEMIGTRINSFVRFHWLDDEDDEKSYFEFKMNYNELTGDFVLEITDFVDPEEKDDQFELWNSQIDTLKRACGM
ncbi:START-like domain-containing protein [uncultured Bacteroides sp.]|uniref:START-like domain-containing protein n=1 Tax=uncultured Bacteroides sp. TaxID=162156 RepID=UPI002AAA8D76|nr:START-like domain-containing protein [uncultured Bacteroides sp.]